MRLGPIDLLDLDTVDHIFTVTWDDVGYYNSHANKLDAFQIQLIDESATGAGNFDIEFRYEAINWTTGDASGGSNGLGGTVARAGFSAGDGATFSNSAIRQPEPDARVADDPARRGRWVRSLKLVSTSSRSATASSCSRRYLISFLLTTTVRITITARLPTVAVLAIMRGS